MINVAKALGDLGWIRLARRDSQDFIKHFADKVCEITTETGTSGDGYQVVVDASVATILFDDIVNAIFSRHGRNVPPLVIGQFERSGDKLDELDAEIRKIIAEVEHWVLNSDVGAAIRNIDRVHKGETMQQQLRHLAALAIDGDYFALHAYKEAILEEDRGGFVPAVTEREIAAALEIAANNLED